MIDPQEIHFDLEDCLPKTLGVPGANLHRVDRRTLSPTMDVGSRMPKLRVTAKEVRIEMHQEAVWRVVEGNRIEVAPASADHWPRARCLTMSTPLCALILQRGDLPIHAACLIPPDRSEAILLCAESGTGKSTTTVAAALRGWTVLSDDVTQIVGFEGIAMALPGWATVKLWPEACALLGIPEHRLPDSPGLKDKRLWLPPRIGDKPARVSRVVVLQRGQVPEGTSMERVGGADSIKLLQSQVYRPRLLGRIGNIANQLGRLVELANTAEVFRLKVATDYRPERVLEALAAIPEGDFPVDTPGP